MADSRDALWDTGIEEEVQVNQRALIDKVLARYSGQFTVFRELLQNSDDAAAKTVEIHLNTPAYLDASRAGTPLPEGERSTSSSVLPHDLENKPVIQWVFRNDGMPFGDQDWSRLKKIAEGNPDEQKIGAFGVGFYSLFSVTDLPLVKSGAQWLGFYWKDNKDQLFVKRGALPSRPDNGPSGSPWTSFEMPLREPSPLPGPPIDIARFLASSLVFMTHLQDVSLFLDQHRLVHIHKDVGPQKTLGVPINLKSRSPLGTMEVKTVYSNDVRITANVLGWVYETGTKTTVGTKNSLLAGGFFSAHLAPHTPNPSLTPDLQAHTLHPLNLVKSSILLTVYSSQADVSLDAKMSAELVRATKKKSPTTCSCSLIYTGKTEYESSKQEDERDFKATGSIFRGLRADLDASGTARVYIGHATSQSTGIGGHLSAPFIPTVERESIDLVDINISQWNKELFYVVGFLARSVYEIQLSAIRASWNLVTRTTTPNNAVLKDLEDKSVHTLRFYGFYSTTPSDLVGSLVKKAFFGCGDDQTIPVISTKGIQPAPQVRFYNPTFQLFMKNLPILSKDAAEDVPAIVTVLRDGGILQDINFKDILEELSSRVLSEEEMVECLRWMINLDTREDQTLDLKLIRAQFLQSGEFSPSNNDQSPHNAVVRLASIQTFIPVEGAIPPNSPLLHHTFPYSISKQFESVTLRSTFGWRELGVVEWVEYLVTPSTLDVLQAEENLTVSADFAEKILVIIAKTWSILPKDQRTRLGNLLKDKTVIPTRSGLKVPSESYFSNINVFQDLPIVALSHGTVIKDGLEELLIFLGVRKHVELRNVFARMDNPDDWGVHDLMKYLVAVKSSLTEMELEQLRHTAAFSQEPGPYSLTQSWKRTVLSKLYEPLDALRELGLPVLDWGSHEWNPCCEEAKLIFDLGLRRFPELPTILDIMAKPEEQLNKKALKYFLNQFDSRYSANYDPRNFIHLAYVPAMRPDGTHFLSKPKEVFVDLNCGVMGFPVVVPEHRKHAGSKLRISSQPPISSVIEVMLHKFPTDHWIAQRYFEYLATRISEFSQAQYSVLQGTCIVPAIPPSSDLLQENATWVMAMPGECFFKTEQETPSSKLHARLFTFVDFGPTANMFLRACGVRDHPTIEEEVAVLLKNPPRFLNLIGGTADYLQKLRQIAAHRNYPSEVMDQMRASPFLLGIRRTVCSAETLAPGEDDAIENEFDLDAGLLIPEKLVIVDDSNTYNLFSDVVYAAPQEDMLETFYLALGSPKLTNLIKEDYQLLGVDESMSDQAKKTRNLILDRFPLLLHERDTRAKHKPDWLSQGNNFRVRSCEKLKLNRTLTFCGSKITKSQELSATARKAEDDCLTLYISKYDMLDMHEVADSMCKVMLKKRRPNDSLLFMVILTTSLQALRRRGYNVDRILHQQKVEDKLREAQGTQQQRQSSPHLKASPAQLVNDSELSSYEPITPASASTGAIPGFKPKPRGMNLLRDTFNRFKDRLVGGEAGHPDATVTPMRDILEHNIGMAIKACCAKSGPNLENKEQMTMVKESLNESYCDVAGSKKNFKEVEMVAGYRLFVANDVPNPQHILQHKQQSIEKFAKSIIDPLADVFGLPSASLHIFFDQKGDLIAFNNDNSLFLNLRFYEGWHHSDVSQGKVKGALISWYHTLAHEIAHNLVHFHNAQHEFYFSAICEKYHLDLSKYLVDVPSSDSQLPLLPASPPSIITNSDILSV